MKFKQNELDYDIESSMNHRRTFRTHKSKNPIGEMDQKSENMPYTSTSITLMFIALLCDVGLGSHQENAENSK